MKKFFVSLAVLPLLSGPAFAAPALDAAATDVCKCLAAPQGHVRLMMELASKAEASGDTTELMSAQEEMQGIIEASGQCFAALSTKYPEIDQSVELQGEVMASAQMQCPDPLAELAMNRQ